ncbi:MAG: sulfotransferase [Rhodospirillales bacterium]|nr:sulfotransferase [Rhodospirillales bacterium]MBN8927614.1 sulfotransferase [Rhodospirillales bacterium]
MKPDHLAPGTMSLEEAAAGAILIVGAPRSGTTWLAKIVDSHPDVLYRHEPDEAVPSLPDSDPARQIVAWAKARTLRTAVKRPTFPKSFITPPRAMIRAGLAHVLGGVARLPGAAAHVARLPVPDLVVREGLARLRVALKLVNWNSAAIARALPRTRHLFILRHPCGQAASIMRGLAQQRFHDIADGLAPSDAARTKAYAERHGVSARAFAELPLPARLAWNWRAFNETALASLETQENVRVVSYEALCAEPVRVTRSLFEFAGLSWDGQTEAFLASSTQTRDDAYFGVMRHSADAASQWRRKMSPEDQRAVLDVVSASPLTVHLHDWAPA